MNRVHAAPFLVALKGQGSPAMKVSDGSVDPKTLPPYVIVYFSATTPEATSLEDAYDRVEATAIVHYVGSNAEACRLLADRGWDALIGRVPEIAGRMCGPIRLVDSQPPRRDESTGVLIVDQVDVYQYVSVPG